ncbi:hypothetical protein ACWDCC_16235 [Streptomyces sp. NPDC001102]
MPPPHRLPLIAATAHSAIANEVPRAATILKGKITVRGDAGA